MNFSTLPRLALTIGDPAGIGPEITLEALTDPRLAEHCHLTVFGSREILLRTFQEGHKKKSMVHPDNISLIDIPLEGSITTGFGDAVSGSASFNYLDSAITETLKGNFEGIVTNPISKISWQIAGHNYPGQTEVLAKGAGVERYGMLFVAKSPHTGWMLRTLLATTHIPLAAVPTALTPQLMSMKLELLITTLKQDFGIDAPTIAIAGLNPHSGEGGKLGTEEQDWLIPWLEKLNYPQVKLIGPVPPDTLWVKPGQAWFNDKNVTNVDAYLALYHDQGLIPVKLMAFDLAVNTTIGLPFVRTSPDHGTAFDIAGQGIAQSGSLKEAIFLAAELCKVRKTALNKVLL